MKNVIYLFVAVILFAACEKDESSKTTYEVVNNSEKFVSSMEYLDGTLWEIVVYQFIGDDIVKQDNLDPIAYGGTTSGKIEVDNNVEKVKLSFKFFPKKSEYYDLSSNNRKYVVAYTYIEEGKNNIIEVDGETMSSGSLKSAKVNNLNISDEYFLEESLRNIRSSFPTK